jgi:integrating conjugative element protein (TIGR03749 family)
MKKIAALGLSILFAMPLVSFGETSSVHFEHALWEGIPIRVMVPVGEERIIKFEGPVEVHNTNSNLTSDKVSLLNNNGFLYLKAKTAFEAIRVPVTIKKTGEVILVDLSASTSAEDTPLEIVSSHEDSVSEGSGSVPPEEVNFVTLTRTAIQELYAPQRLIEPHSSITRVPMGTAKSVSLFADGSVMAMPLVSWSGGNFYVTAVLLKNAFKETQILDPRHLSGNWLAASFYPSNVVTAVGSDQDRTTLFLISNEPFNAALSDIRRYRS